MNTIDQKYENLKENIAKYRTVVIAFSGGVDSTFLARVAGDVLDKRILLITATSSTYPRSELQESQNLAALMNLPHRIIVSEEIDIEGFSENPPDRCYYCKRELFSKIVTLANEESYDVVFDGSNADDLSDYRPGRRALKEKNIVSPLCDANLTKSEIRELSERLGLPTAKKPAFACLASRFPYGESITLTKLERVGQAEEQIRALGFHQLRVRSHDNLARIEIAPDEMDTAWQKRAKLREICKNAGFVYVAIDTDGYRTGAMNEMLY